MKYIIIGREEIIASFDNEREAKKCIKNTYKLFPNHTKLKLFKEVKKSPTNLEELKEVKE